MAYTLRHRVYTTRRFRKAITPARHWQKRTDVVRVVARKHQRAVAGRIKDALDHIAALAIHQHGVTRDVGHHLTLVKADWDESEHPRDEHGEFTFTAAIDQHTRLGVHNNKTDTYAGITSGEWQDWAYNSHAIQDAHAGRLKIGDDMADGETATEKDVKEFNALAPRIQAAAEHNAVTVPGGELYRGDSFETEKDFRAKFKHNALIETASLTSTTSDPEIAKQYSSDGLPVRAVFRYGSKYATFRGVQTSPLGVPSNEIVMPQGVKFRVGRVFKDTDGIFQVDMYSTDKISVKGNVVNAANPGHAVTKASSRDEHGAWVAKAAVPLPEQGMQVNVTMPTSHEIQAQLKLVYDAVAVAAKEVAEKTASQIAAERGAAAAEKFMADWQTYMTGQIQQVTQEIQASIQQVMSAGAYAGLGPSTVARDVRDMIGLTERQQGYVESYRQSLEALDGDALDRVLRSTGADRRVAAAIDNEEDLPGDYVDRLVARYAENWRNYRADMIARTELITANNEGARAGMEAVIDAGTFDRLEVRRYWLVAMDEDTCQICLSIPELNPDGVGMDEEFQVDSEDGTIFAPTAHPNCRCSIAYKNVPNA